MRAFLLAAGRGVRFQPVTESIPKPLFPFLNVPMIVQHLQRLRRHGVAEAGINLHHLGDEIRRHLRESKADLPDLVFFPEPYILGTAGALRNAADWLSGDDFLLVNTDAAIEPAFETLIEAHRRTAHAATLLVVENHEPRRYTPLQAEGDRIVGFGRESERPLLYTGVCVLSPRLLSRIPSGERSLVSDLWQPLLEEGHETIGWISHQGPFSDLGVPRDFLRASLEALARGGPFPQKSGDWNPRARVLSRTSLDEIAAASSAIGRAKVGKGARLRNSVVWDGAEIGEGARVDGCLHAAGHVAAGASHREVLLWPSADGTAIEHPLESAQGVQRFSPRR